MNTEISPTLEIRNTAQGKKICCIRCGYALVSPGTPWKASVIVREMPTDAFSANLVIDGPAATLLRQFVCPGCGVLLDTEIAIADDPFLEDVVGS